MNMYKERMYHMKVLMINGSRRDNGCTYTALCEIAKELTAGDHDCFREKRRMESRTPAA